jgi:hypothetical protein
MTWKIVTETGGSTKIFINLDLAVRMVQEDDATTIYFMNDQDIEIKETPLEIIQTLPAYRSN